MAGKLRRKGIPGYPGYAASEDGRIWSYWVPGRWRKRRKEPRQLSTHRNKQTGYHMCRVTKSSGKGCTVAVHTLVLLAFVGRRPRRKQARHEDGDKDNNRLSNLSYGTKKENAQDKFRHGTQAVGDDHHNTKLTRKKIKQVWYWRRKGLLQREIAAKLGVSQPLISAVLSEKEDVPIG